MSDFEFETTDRFAVLAQYLLKQNPPGQSVLKYRFANYRTSYQRMVEDLHTQNYASVTDASVPMLPLSTIETQNWTVGLLQSWAMVIDVLTFYQERIANEGFIRTATERRSLLELARTVGYRPGPGVAATTALTFTVRNPPGTPSQGVRIPAGMAVQSVPTQGQKTIGAANLRQAPTPDQLPQVFETSTAFEAQPEWNTFGLVSRDGLQWDDVRPESTNARLTGVKSNLHPGDSLLVVGSQADPGGQPQAWMLAEIQAVEPNPKGGFTLITYQRQAGVDPSGGAPFSRPAVFVLRRQAGLRTYDPGGIHFTPPDAGRWSPSAYGMPNSTVHDLIRTEAGWLLAATDKGIFRSTDDGLSWQDVSAGLMRSSIFSLAAGAGQRIYSGSDSGAVFVSPDSGGTWKPINGLDIPAVRSLATLLNLPAAPANASLPKAVVRKLLVTIENGAEHLAAATDQGVFLSDDQGRSWQRATLGDLRPNESYGVAWTLKAGQNRWKRLVGTDKGVFQITPPELTNPIVRPGLRLGPLSMPVRALVALADNTIFAGTGGGVFRWNDRSRTWSPANQGLLIALFNTASAGLVDGLDKATLPDRLRQDFNQNKINLTQNITVVVVQAGQHWQLADQTNGITYTLLIKGDQVTVYHVPDVRSLLFVAPASLYAGTLDGSVFRSLDNGQTWTHFSQDLRSGAVDGLLAAADGIFAAGAPAGSDPDSQWMRVQLQNEQIDLDKIYPEITQDSWIILRQDSQAALYRVVDVRIRGGSGGHKVGSFTSLRVTGAAALSGFDRLKTQALIQSEALVQFDDAPVSGTQLTFDRFVPGLEPGHHLVVTGKRMCLRLAGSGMVPLQSPDGLAQRPVLPGDILIVMGIPKPASAGGQTWLLQDRHGFTGVATLDENQAVLVPAGETDETLSEVHVLADASATVPTRVILQEPVAALYDRSTVSLSANVVPASHGQTVDSEALGAAAPTTARPSFILKNKPLTYVPDMEHGGVISTLAVQVSQVKWHEVNALNDLGGDQRAYMVRQDANDRTEILFGDGEHGARLPGGSDNVSATYRVGIGEAGNLPPNSLTMLRTRPPGIQAVTNPVAASGGAEPEGPDVLRQRAPLQVRNPNRLVSLKDYEDYALNFNGIARAQARPLWDSRTRLLHLTVAGEGGAAIDPKSGMYAALIKAILSLRAAGGQHVQVDSYELLVFNLTAILIHDSQDAQNSEELTAAAVLALKAAFSFPARDFELPVPASEVIAVLQGVSGVRAVELEALYLNGQDPSTNTSLEAQPARLVDGKIRPAQLLVINATGPQGIQLTVQEAQ